jgi:hypothetical protein
VPTSHWQATATSKKSVSRVKACDMSFCAMLGISLGGAEAHAKILRNPVSGVNYGSQTADRLRDRQISRVRAGKGSTPGYHPTAKLVDSVSSRLNDADDQLRLGQLPPQESEEGGADSSFQTRPMSSISKLDYYAMLLSGVGLLIFVVIRRRAAW